MDLSYWHTTVRLKKPRKNAWQDLSSLPLGYVVCALLLCYSRCLFTKQDENFITKAHWRGTLFSIWKRKKTARTFSHNLVQAAAAAATGAGAPPLSKLLLFRLRMVFYDGDQSRALYAMITLRLKSTLKLLTNSDWFLYRVLLLGLEFATIISLKVGRGYHSTELLCALFCQCLCKHTALRKVNLSKVNIT